MVGFCSGQYLTQKCQYDNKPLTKSFVGDTRKIEYGKWYTKYSCTGIKQHEYWIPDAQPNYSQGGAEALGYGCGVLLGALLVKAIKNNSAKNKNNQDKNISEKKVERETNNSVESLEHNSEGDWLTQKNFSKKNKYKNSTKQKPKRPKKMTKKQKDNYLKAVVIYMYVFALLVQSGSR